MQEEKKQAKEKRKQARAKSADLKKRLPENNSKKAREERIRELLQEDQKRRQVMILTDFGLAIFDSLKASLTFRNTKNR